MEGVIKTNVCIVGAGPSGAATSLRLSQLGISHTIIDKSVFPRDKTCGDGLILYAYKSLKKLNLLEQFFSDERFLHSKKINLHIKHDVKISFKESEDRGAIISYAKRIDFDHFLVNQFSKKYTTTIFGDSVKKCTQLDNGILLQLKSGTQILSKIIVGADGVQSIVARRLSEKKVSRNKTSTFVSAYFEDVENLPINNEAEVRLLYKNMPLFFYIFPLANGQTNVSLGGRTDKLQKHNINLIDEVEAILQNHPKVYPRFTKAERLGSWRGWTIPFHYGTKKVYGNHFLLTGDAAGLANAFYKEGVGTGMMSGILAANIIAKSIEKGDFSEDMFKVYQNQLQNEFGKLLRFSYLSLKIARYKNLFCGFSKIFKKRVENKTPKIVKNRSY